MEAVINNVSDFPLLLVNLASNDNHWLGIHLVGVASNRDAIGARVVVHGSNPASRVWVDEVRSGSSYSSNNDMRLHFGLRENHKCRVHRSALAKRTHRSISRLRGGQNHFPQRRFRTSEAIISA